MDSTKGRFCPIWAQIEALSHNMGLYETKCGESCTNYSTELGSCIELSYKYSLIKERYVKEQTQ